MHSNISVYVWGFGVLWWGAHVVCGLCKVLDRSWGAGMWCQATKLYFLDSDAFRWWAHLPNSSSELVKHVVLWDEKLLRWAMKPGECVTLRGHHNDRIMHQAGVTNVLRDGVRLKLIQVLGNSAIPMMANWKEHITYLVFLIPRERLCA